MNDVDANKLYEYCREGNFEGLKEIYKNRNKSLYEKLELSYQDKKSEKNDWNLSSFMLLCAGGYLEIAQWHYLCKMEDLKITSKKSALKGEYRTNELKLRNSNGMTAFLLACKYNRLDIVQWLYMIDPEQINDVDRENNTCFMHACTSSNSELIEWIYSKAPELINVANNKNERPFMYACLNGNLLGAKWIYSIVPEEINKLDNQKKTSLIASIQSKNVELSQWIYSIVPEQLNMSYDEHCYVDYSLLFRHHIVHKLKLPTYFNENSGGEYFIITKKPLDVAIDNCCTEILKWIHTINPEEINAKSEDIFRNGVCRDNLSMCQWIYQINPHLSNCKYKPNMYCVEDLQMSDTINIIDYALLGKIKTSKNMLVWLTSINNEYDSDFIELVNVSTIDLLKQIKMLKNKLTQCKQ